MPPVTRWMLKTSLIYLTLALLVGIMQGLARVWPNMPLMLRQLEPIRMHLFAVGWITLLIFGVFYWMFPKYSREMQRGHEWLSWSAYGLPNAGLILRVIGDITDQPGTIFGWILVVSTLFQWLAQSQGEIT